MSTRSVVRRFRLASVCAALRPGVGVVRPGVVVVRGGAGVVRGGAAVGVAVALVAGTLTLAAPAVAAAACTPTSAVDGQATVLTFTNAAACDWTVPANVPSADVLVIAGGGGAGNGGGGAGGLIYRSTAGANPVSLTPGATVPVTVGTGGAGASGGNGTGSSFGAVTTVGGGGGGSAGLIGIGASVGAAGGSGGGGGQPLAGNNVLGGAGTSGQGFAGGPGQAGVGSGGGGGAGGVGGTGGSVVNPGPGVSNSITGTAVTYAAGGTSSSSYAYSGQAAGADNPGPGNGGRVGSGGSLNSGKAGIVVVRYPTPVAPTFTAATPTATAVVGTAYPAYTFTAYGVPAPTFAVGSGSLPAGLSLNTTTGVLSGTPTGTGGVSTFTVTATNVLGTATTSTRTITVSAAPLFTASTATTIATVGTPYSFTFAATGYLAPTFAVASGALPAGLSLDTTTGVLSGTPTGTGGVSTFAVTATNVTGAVTTSTNTITVASAPVFTASSPPTTGTVSTAYAGYTFAASGYPTAMTFAVASGALPAGLSLNPTTGALSGTPTGTGGVSTFTVSASNGTGAATTATQTLTVAAAPVLTGQAVPATATVGTPYLFTFTATGYPAPTFGVASGALPAGLSLNTTTGVLSGTPTAPGTANFTVSATNATSTATTSAKSVAVSPAAAAPAFIAATPPVTGTVGTTYAGYTFTASGYPTPTFALASGTLPAGLSLDPATGALAGTPTGAGTSTVTVSATNSSGTATTASISIAISPAAAAPAFTASSPTTSGTVGTTYPSYTFTASGYPAPTFAVATGALPGGLALDAFTGVLSGTPTTAGTWSFTVSATNASGAVSTPSRTITVIPANAAPALTAASPPVTGTVGTAYPTYTYTASGYPAPTFAPASGALPGGLTLTSGGALAGTPTTAGTFTFTVSATNSSGTVSTASTTITVSPAAAAPVFTASNPPSTGTVSTAYAGYTFTASGYPAPTFAVASGSLPTGLTLDGTTGVLAGTPTAAGAFTFTVSAGNASGAVNSPSRTITVVPANAAPAFTADSPPATGTVGTTYSTYTFTASGYPAPTFAVASGALPAGLTLSAAGVLSGTPTTAATYTFTVSATNGVGSAASSSSRTVTISPAAAAPVLTAATPPATGTVATAYAGYTFTASGYPAPAFAVATGSLPAGLSLDAFTGVLAGTPTTAGSSTFTVSATNPSGAVSSASRTITISPADAAPAFTAATPPTTGTVGTAYSTYVFTASGYPVPTFAVASGALPAGLTLSSAGVLSGTPTTASTSTFTVSATNGVGSAATTTSRTITVSPAAAAPVFTASAPPNSGTVGTPYAGYTFTASGYPAPTFSVTTGSLPNGLTLDGVTGVLAGTPTTAGSSTFTVSADNASGAVGTPSRTITISPADAAPAFTAASPPTTGTVGTSYPTYTFTASGYPAPTFSVASGALPAGLTLSAAGVLAGTPTTAATYTFTVSAGNGVGSAATTAGRTVTVSPAVAAPVFTASGPPSTGTVGTAYAGYVFAANGYPAPTFAVVSGSLPAGLALDAATGALSGTPTTAGSSSFAVSATNAGGTVSTGSKSIVVSPAAAAPVFTASSPPVTGTVGTAYATYTFTASGYPAPVFAVDTGALPAGLTLTTGGALAGTPTAAATSTFTVSATNASGTVSTSSVSIAVSPAAAAPVFTAAGPSTTGTVSTTYRTYTFAASGYPAPVFAIASGALPAGLALDPFTGDLSGTPTAPGTSTFTVSAANASGTVSTGSIVITVSPAAAIPAFTAATPPAGGTVGTAYPTYTFTASGYPGPVFAVASGALPTGLTLSGGGVLAGTPTAAGVATFTVSATNSSGAVTTGSISITVSPAAAAPAFTAASPPTSGTVGNVYTGYTFTASGYPAPTFAVASGALPTGLTLSAGGVLSGTPTAAGTATFTVSATNASGTVSTGSKSIVVTPAAADPVFTADSPPATATVGTSYPTYQFAASGYPAPAFAKASGSLPTGMSLSSSGVLAGTPTAAGSFTFTVSATNSGATVTTTSRTIAVEPAAAAPVFTASTPPTSGTVQSAYAGYTFTASGYPAPTFAVATGALPAGLSLDAFTGVLSGTPTTAGTATFTVSATNASGTVGTTARSIVVSPAAAAPVFTASSPPATGTVGATYPGYTFTATGYPDPTFTLATGTLPTGLTLSSTGVLAGTPSGSGTFGFTVAASNGGSPVITAALSIVVSPAAAAPVFTAMSPSASGIVGATYPSYTFTASGYPAPAFAVASGALPAGLTLTTGGVLAGTPTAAGSSTFTVSATNASGTVSTGTKSVVVRPADAAPLFTSSAPPTATEKSPYSYTFTASGYPAPTFTVDPATLPSGLTLTSVGVLAGTPATATAGAYPLTVTASNGVGADATSSFTLTVDPEPIAPTAPVFTGAAPAAGTVGAVYSHTFTVIGYPAATFAAVAADLPDGLTLDQTTGELSGTPTTAGTSTFTVTATNGNTPDASRSVTLTVRPAPAAPVFTSSAPVAATVGAVYSHSFAASGYPAPTFSTSDPLPVGLTLSSAGVLSGTPSTGTAGPYAFTVTATNGVGTDDTQAVSFTVIPAAAGPVFTASTPAASATVGTAYTGYTFAASGYPAPTFALDSGSLPAGLTLSSSGVLSGTPTAPGTATFTVSATNATTSASTGSISIVVSPAAAAPVFTGAAPAGATVGTAYSHTFTATGYPAPTFTTTDPLPVGLTLSSGGVLAGTPSTGTAGPYAFTVTASNGVGTDDTRAVTFTVVPAASAPSFGVAPVPPTATVGAAYSYTFSPSGYPAPTFALVSGTLPAGLSLSANGVLSGTPTSPGSATFTVSASNATSPAATASITMTINPADAAALFTGSAPAPATVGTAYSHTFTASGFPAVTFTTTDPLPVGLTLSSSGELAGTPASGTVGSYPFTVTASNGVGADDTRAVTFTVVPAASAPSFGVAPVPPTATVGAAYSYTFSPSGYPAPTFALVSGTLPAGLSLSANGVLSGTPTSPGSATFTVSASNATSPAATASITMTINPPASAPLFTSTAPAGATVGTTYSHTFTASGFPAATFTTTDPLPVGLTLSSSGVLTGTPATGTAGSYPFTVTAANGVNPAATSSVVLSVVPAASGPALTAASPPATATVGSLYPAYTFTASGYPAPTFTVVTGGLPTGLSLSAGGALTGTPTVAGTFTFTVQALNATAVVTAVVTITVDPAPAAPLFSSPPPATATIGSPYTHTFTATGFPASAFTTTDPLPIGLTLSTGGVLAGTPASGTVGSYPITVTASNAVGTDTSVLTFVVDPAPAAPSFPVAPTPSTATIGTAYTYTFSPSAYPAPTFALVTGSLPAGLSLSTAGVLTGTPTGPSGTATFSVAATNASGTVISPDVSLTVVPAAAAPLFTSTAPAAATVGTAYTHTFTTSGYPVPTFTTSDPLPVGLSLTAGGLLAGTASTGSVGSYPVTVTAANGVGSPATSTFTLVVTPAAAGPSFPVTPVPPTATVGTAYTYTFAGAGYPAPSYTIASGTLPAGLALAPSTGALSGTPTGPSGSSTFTVAATNVTGTATTGPITLTVDPPATAPLFSGLPAGPAAVGTPYSFLFSASGFPAPTFSTTDPLPVGLTLSAAGLLAGTPAAGSVGSYPVTVTATNPVGSATNVLTLHVDPPSTAALFTGPDPATVTVGTAYLFSFATSGFPAPTFTTTDPLPTGLTLTTAGLLAGTAGAGAVGSYPVTVTATNGIGAPATRSFTLVVDPPASAPVFTAAVPAAATIGTPYSFSFAASGFPVPTFSTPGPLPVGLALAADGTLAGTPSSGTAGSYSFTVSAVNASGTVSTAVSLTVVPAAAAVTFPVAPVPPTGTVGTPYAYTFATSGYPAPTFAVTTGSLPAGLTLTAGSLAGTPTAATVATFTIAATNSSGTVSTGPITLTVEPAPTSPTFTAALPPGGTEGTAYTYAFAASGFPLPTFTTAAALPVGLTLTGAGVLLGTPATGSAGAYPITVTATNGLGAVSTSFTLTVARAPAPPVLVATTPPSTSVVGTTYNSYVFTASGVPAPVFAVAAGSLPPGMTLNPVSGALTGTPSAAGVFGFRVQAQNSLGTETTGGLTVTVTPAPAAPTFSSGSPSPTGTVGTAYTFRFGTTGYPLPTFAVASGSLPAGLTLDPVSGVLSGTPSAAGTSEFTVSATNSVSTTDTGLITLAIGSAPTSGGGSTTPTTPVAPASVAVVAGTASLTATWAAVPGATGYTATASPGQSTCSTTTSTSCVLGAVAGTTYTVTVVARTADGVSAASPASSPAAPIAPAVPPAAPPEAPTTLTTDKGQTVEVERGSAITVIGTGFAPFSTVTVIIYSTPIVLGNAVTDSAGAFSLPVTIPAGLEIGVHTFLASGVDRTGVARMIDLPVTVPEVTTGGGGGNDTPVGRARLTFGARVLASAGSHATVIAPCALDVGVIRVCTVTATVPETVQGKVHRVVVGTGVTRLTAKQKLGAVKVSIPLTKRGRALVARPGGVKIRFVAVVSQRGVTEKTSATRTPTVLARRFTLSPTVHFTASSSTLRASDRSYLKAVRAKLGAATAITCVGHADTRGTAGSVRALGARRGKAACTLLAKTLSVKVTTSGQAEKKPKGKKNTAAARAKNRRVTITIWSSSK